jgi:pilus assembly protein CpaE
MTLRNLSIMAFADVGSLHEAATAMARDSRLAKCRVEVRTGSAVVAAEWLTENRSPDVLIIGESMEGEVWQRLNRLAENVEPLCKVVVVGRKDSIALYRELTGRGIADYLGGAVSGHDLMTAVMRLYAAEDSLPKGKLIVAMPASGGAGGSLVAAVIANELQKRLGDALLFDLDLGTGTAALALGLDVRDSVADALSNSGLDAAMLERFIVRDKGPKVLSTHGSLRCGSGLEIDTAERAVNIARNLAKVVVVDLPKGWSETHQRLIAAADDIAIVVTPDLASLRNGRMILDDIAVRRAEAPRPKIIVNKSGMAKGAEYSAVDIREALGTPPTALIPWDPAPLTAALVNGKPVVDAGGKAISALRGVAAMFLPPKQAENKGARHSAAAPALFKGLIAKFA